MRRKYWFPGMTAFVRKYIGHCIICLSSKRPSGPKQGLLHPIEKLPIPFHTIHADCTGPFGTARDRYRYLLLLVDAYTKFTILIPIENLTGTELVRALEPQLSLFGTTKRIITDKGTNFSSKQTKELLKRMDIEIHYIATGASRANGQAERYVSTVLNLLACEVSRGSEWSSVVHKIQLTLNTTIQKVLVVLQSNYLLEYDLKCWL